MGRARIPCSGRGNPPLLVPLVKTINIEFINRTRVAAGRSVIAADTHNYTEETP